MIIELTVWKTLTPRFSGSGRCPCGRGGVRSLKSEEHQILWYAGVFLFWFGTWWNSLLLRDHIYKLYNTNITDISCTWGLVDLCCLCRTAGSLCLGWCLLYTRDTPVCSAWFLTTANTQRHTVQKPRHMIIHAGWNGATTYLMQTWPARRRRHRSDPERGEKTRCWAIYIYSQFHEQVLQGLTRRDDHTDWWRRL